MKTLKALTVLLILFLAGCGRGGVHGTVAMEAPELGLHMQAPAGWRLDSRNSRMCYHGDNTGLILDEPLEGKDFQWMVRILSQAHGGKVLESTPMPVSGLDAVEMVIDYPHADRRFLKTYIHKGDTLIEVSFATSAAEFSGQEEALRRAMASIEIR